MAIRKSVLCVASAVAALSVVGCSTVGSYDGGAVSQGAGETRSLSQEEKQIGAKAHPELLKEFGGEYKGAQADYVRRIGLKMAAHSNVTGASNEFTVTLINSAVNNAFAIPGGYVYITRQLMSLMPDEAALAGVLGHEVGHVAAEHWKERQQVAQRNSILGLLGTIAGGLLGNSGGLLGALGGLLQNNALQVAQMATLSHSRSEELESDDLGIRYLNLAGYDPAGMADGLRALALQSSLEARATGRDARSIPEWASTHPDPARRVSRAQDIAAQLGTTGIRNRETFLNTIDGMLYADDPKQGVIEGQTFLHPDLRLAFTVPNGFGMQNGTRAVTITGSSGQGQFSTGPYNGSLDRYIDGVFRALGGQQQRINYGRINRTTINGLPAAYATARVNSQSGAVDVVVFAYEFSNSQAFHFLTISQARRSNPFGGMYRSLRKLSSSEAAEIRPRRIDIVTVQQGDTIDSLARRMAYRNLQRERFMVLNGMDSRSSLKAGQRVKIVTY